MTLKIAHISDLHFSHLSFDPGQFFSKRWIGNLNLVFSRKKGYTPEKLETLHEAFSSLGVTHLLITGDVTTTSLKEEFVKAQEFVKKFENMGIQTFVIPGNHDHYTKAAYKSNLFYEYFPSHLSPLLDYNLIEHRVAAMPLSSKWWFVLLDTARATSLISSRGEFSEEIEKNLRSVLSQIPKDTNVILLNHFPLFQNDHPRKELTGAKRLQKVLEEYPQVKLYLHGHSHRHCIADLRENGYPIVIDSGSTARAKDGTWNFIEIEEKNCQITAFRSENSHWETFQKHSMEW